MLKITEALIRAFLCAAVTGVLCTIVQSILFGEKMVRLDELIFVMIGGIFTSCFLAFLLCLLLLLLAFFMEAKKIQEQNLEGLIQRYLPLIVVPFGVIFLLNFLLNEIRESYYIVQFFLLNAYVLSTKGLLVFLKKIKSSE